MLTKRVLTSLWGIPLLVAAIWFDQPLPWFTILICAWGMLAVSEFYNLVSYHKGFPLTFLGILFTLLFILSRDAEILAFLSPHIDIQLITPLLITISALVPLIFLIPHFHTGNTFTSWVWTIAGIIYVGWLLGFMVALRGMDGGRDWILLTFFVTFASDTAAYFTGRAFGKTKLAPHISPRKTWEGAIGGVAGAMIVAFLFTIPTFFSLPILWWQAVILGFFISLFGQLGDLAESMFKRNMEVKDSGNTVPGHGGFLDRLDSLVFAGVVVYYFVVFFFPS